MMEAKIDSSAQSVDHLQRLTGVQVLRDQVTVVIPTLNEEEAIGPLVDEIKGRGYVNVLIVDGYSKDSTVEVAQKSGAQVVMQHGTGKAGALLTAFRKVETPYVVVIDGDGSYDPHDIDRFLPMMDDYQFIKGARERNENMSKIHRIGNSVITKTFNLLFGTSVQDICSGMYLLRTEPAKDFDFEKHPMTVEQELAAQVVLAGGRITSVPINYRKRFGGESKTHTWRQGFRDLITNFDLARTYNPIMLFSFLAALALIPAFTIMAYASLLFLLERQWHGGYFLFSMMLFIVGFQGLSLASISAFLKRIERRTSNHF